MTVPIRKRQPRPVQQHFVPKCILEGFTNAEGALHFSRREWSNSIVHSSTPAKLFREGHIYTMTRSDGKEDFSLEQRYSEMESEIRPVLAVLRSDNPRPLLAGEKDRLLLFIYHLWKRSPDMHGPIFRVNSDKEALQFLKNAWQEKGHVLSAHEEQMLQQPGIAKMILQTGKVGALDTNGERVIAALKKRSMLLLTTEEHRSAFIVSSLPVIKLGNADSTSLEHPESEVWVQIGSRVALCLIHGHAGATLKANMHQVRELNMKFAAQSTMIAARSEFLIKSLRKQIWT